MALALDISNAQSTSFAPSDSDLPSTVGRSCSAPNNHLDTLSHKFISDCDPKSFCSSATNGTCQPRVCRRDEFAYGYLPDEVVPSLCPEGAFCPDDGSGCVGQREVGGECEMGRDEQCVAMEGWDSEGAGLGDRMNVNGSVCLKGVCAYANVGINQPCTSEVISHEYKTHDGEHYVNVIARDNCLTASLFCSNDTATCQPVRMVGETCRFHRDCQSVSPSPFSNYLCLQGSCQSPPNAPYTMAGWQYAVTAISIIAAMATICVMLTLMHKRHRLKNFQETRDYCYEQITLRRSIMEMNGRYDRLRLRK
ncbi:uncharacterized protein STEHIDRAFT_163139 [Stereum hirsutum FP-91666 SS1]|uniref:Uncharacterized protein n=1 Tax=Stereum hirsutum (strain FP-91666) TaxID=721885 RepID=R7RYI8_STEHR|nr:uncharacterized protein STEHIDRAFT_163139 [Stereum hirsutum FP-91666 SS1]EIM79883.1 hypothetical protein STEHIDRAFT_163139 [Stereum hirsutum FP-91666 SS1]